MRVTRKKERLVEAEQFYFYLFVPLIFMVFPPLGQNLYSFAFYRGDDSENFLPVIYAIVSNT